MSEPIIAEFNLEDGIPVSVNLALVSHWEPVDRGTLIVFSDTQNIVVRETYDQVSEALNPERKSGD